MELELEIEGCRLFKSGGGAEPLVAWRGAALSRREPPLHEHEVAISERRPFKNLEPTTAQNNTSDVLYESPQTKAPLRDMIH